MNQRTSPSTCRRYVCPRWVLCPALWLLGTSACKPREVVCESRAFYQVLSPEQGAGGTPSSIERLGPEVKRGNIEEVPIFLTFTGGYRARAEWMSLGHIPSYAELLYSPGEGLARNVNAPRDVYPMRRLGAGESEHVWFGFRSAVCSSTDGRADNWPCRYEKEKGKLFLVADMACTRK